MSEKRDRRKDNKAPQAYGPKDGMVCLADEVAAVINEWKARHDKEHPAEIDVVGGAFSTSQYSAHTYIAERLGHNPKNYNRLVHKGQVYMSFTKAEKLLLAIEEQTAFYDGRVKVIPNPYWPLERWLRWKEEQGCV